MVSLVGLRRDKQEFKLVKVIHTASKSYRFKADRDLNKKTAIFMAVFFCDRTIREGYATKQSDAIKRRQV